ncbi:MFS transporter [Bradyrhizobium sp. CCBAU 21360]|uniref:MFS transporter n=1 Tax=Bradyrhizobium sp. CCBAU 21360 TaxID=1325081 RepID=UPI003FA49F6F
MWNDDKIVVAALGCAEIISYGTLYYCIAGVANEVARDLAVTGAWIVACFSFAQFASAPMSLIAGRLMDRYGAARAMEIASVVGATSLGIAAVSWNATVFAFALFSIQIASAFVFYEAAVLFLIQRDGVQAKQQIARLTLISGLSSTLFWPLTSLLLIWISWREMFGIYAGCNVLIALPLMVWARRRVPVGPADLDKSHKLQVHSQSSPKTIDCALMTFGFSLTAFVVSAFLSQMTPILSTFGLGPVGPLISALFGPSQVLILLFAASLTERLAEIHLTLLSCLLLFAATVIVALASHSVLGVTVFVVLLGFSSGLNCICRGTLPLATYGQDRYGGRVGLMNGFRLLSGALAPLFFSSVQDHYGITAALASLAVCGAGSVLAFGLVSIRSKRS